MFILKIKADIRHFVFKAHAEYAQKNLSAYWLCKKKWCAHLVWAKIIDAQWVVSYVLYQPFKFSIVSIFSWVYAKKLFEIERKATF